MHLIVLTYKCFVSKKNINIFEMIFYTATDFQ